MVAHANAVDHFGIPGDRTQREMPGTANMANRPRRKAWHRPRCPNVEARQCGLQGLIDICGTTNIRYPLIEIANDDAGVGNGVRQWLRESRQIGPMVFPYYPIASSGGDMRHVPWDADRNDIDISQAGCRSRSNKATWWQSGRSDCIDFAPMLPAPDGHLATPRNDRIAGIRMTGDPMPGIRQKVVMTFRDADKLRSTGEKLVAQQPTFGCTSAVPLGVPAGNFHGLASLPLFRSLGHMSHRNG